MKNKRKKAIGIKANLIMSVVVIVFLSTAILGFIAYKVSKGALTALGETALNNRVNMGISTLEILQSQIEDGKLSRQDAEEIFRQKMLGVKKPDGKTRPFNDKLELGIKAYMFAIDSKGLEVMHPAKEGDNISSSVDPKGNNIVKLILDEGNNRKNNGIIHFYWQNPGEKTIRPKTNAVAYFKPWDWYINVGAYDEDFYKPAYALLKWIIIIASANIACASLLMFFLISRRINPIKKVKGVIELAAQGQLNQRVTVKINDEIGSMATSFNSMLDSVSGIINDIKNSSSEISEKSHGLSAISEEMYASTEEVSKAMTQISSGTTDQAKDLNEITGLLHDLDKSIVNVYDKLTIVKSEADTSSNKADIGRKEIVNLATAINNMETEFSVVIGKINALNSTILEITNITEAIDDISSQTNLLALNAAIEASRAGEAGRGFSVVADEVRKLAEKSKVLTDEIGKLVSNINEDTKEVLSASINTENHIKQQSISANNTLSSFMDILQSVEKISPVVDISQVAMNDITKSRDIILSKTETVNKVAEEASASGQEINASSDQLADASKDVADTAQSLADIFSTVIEKINKFKI